jgi:hypothetical protein
MTKPLYKIIEKYQVPRSGMNSKVHPRPKLELSLLPPFYEDSHKNENMPFSTSML